MKLRSFKIVCCLPALAILFLLSGVAFAQSQVQSTRWAVGPVASYSPGISLLYLTDPFEGWHLSTFLNQKQNTVFSLDWQRYFGVGSALTPLRPYGNLAVYSGFGMQSVNHADRAGQSLDLRVPVGVEFSSRQLPIQIFGDVAAIFGPMPQTGISGSPRVGLRAVF
jgi:hypothetical protein